MDTHDSSITFIELKCIFIHQGVSRYFFDCLRNPHRKVLSNALNCISRWKREEISFRSQKRRKRSLSAAIKRKRKSGTLLVHSSQLNVKNTKKC